MDAVGLLAVWLALSLLIGATWVRVQCGPRQFKALVLVPGLAAMLGLLREAMLRAYAANPEGLPYWVDELAWSHLRTAQSALGLASLLLVAAGAAVMLLRRIRGLRAPQRG